MAIISRSTSWSAETAELQGNAAVAREPRRGDPIPWVAEDAASDDPDVESDVVPLEIASAPDAESGVDALERATAPDAER